MAGLDEVLERLATDPGFRTRLTSRPWAALAGYDLTAEERELLAERLIAGLRPWPVPTPGRASTGGGHPAG
jgi:hypothetical protein